MKIVPEKRFNIFIIEYKNELHKNLNQFQPIYTAISLLEREFPWNL